MIPNTDDAAQMLEQDSQGSSLTRVSSLIKSAEQNIKAGDYALALQQLAVAQRLDPTNFYIRAIVERANELQTSAPPKVVPPKVVPLKATLHDDHRRHTKVQVHTPDETEDEPEYKTVEVVHTEEESPYFQDRQSRIKELTEAAMKFLNAGSHEDAFDALMSAYLIDPTNRFVVECEKVILPALQLEAR
jgi:hypothetical protein